MKPHVIILLLVSLAFIPEIVFVYRLLKKKAHGAQLPKITIRINLVILGIGVFITGGATLFDINFLSYKAPIEYKDWESITWEDFRGFKRPEQTLDGMENFAFISSQITVKQSASELEVKTLFHPCRSYTFSQESAGMELLQHELYHLHITELWSRKIRQYAKACKSQELLDHMIQHMLEAERNMQHTYDEETYHGYLLGKQRAWQSRIDSSLNRLNLYTDSNVKLTF